jgi:hypothetical protein
MAGEVLSKLELLELPLGEGGVLGTRRYGSLAALISHALVQRRALFT